MRAAGKLVVPASVTDALDVLSNRSAPDIVTLASVPPLPVATRVDPPLATTDPLLIVPPERFQLPVVASSVSVAPVLFNVPVRLTVLPVRENPGKLIPPVLNVPPRFSVALLAVIMPAVSLHAPPRLSVVPAAADTVPALDQLVGAMFNVPAVTCTVP